MRRSTHDLALTETVVTKTYRSWDRGEPDREWAGLTLLEEHAPGLAPRPLGRATSEGRPAITMTRLPGTPLEGPLDPARTEAVAAAMNRLHTAVPAQRLRGVPHRLWGAAEVVGHLRSRVETVEPAGLPVDVGDAYGAGAGWVRGTQAGHLARTEGHEVFAQADGNLANYLWDGSECRLVDFEDSGVGDRAFEIADLVEHVSVWLTGALDADDFLAHLDPEPVLAARVRDMRRLFALFWLDMLLPGNPAHDRNPPGSLERQAARLQSLLG